MWCNFSIKLPWLQRRDTITYYLIDIIYKTVKPSHFEKLQIIQNANKVMFQVIFIFSGWIFIEEIIASSIPFASEKTDFQKILSGVLSGGVGHE